MPDDMKHGRPDAEWIEHTGSVYSASSGVNAWKGDLMQWRSMHAQMVWNAMTAIVATGALL